MQPRKPLEARAAEEKLDELWAGAIYELALAFNFLERPSKSGTAINTTLT